MKAFRFPLQPVLQYRSEIEQQRRRDLARARAEVLSAVRRIVDLGQDRLRAWTEIAAARTRALRMEELLAQQRYLFHLDARLAEAHRDLAAKTKVEEDRRHALLRAARERRALERLRERRLADYRYEAAREEQKFLDEIASAREDARRRPPRAGAPRP